MNNILIENLVNATSYDEIISYKTDVLAAYESLYKECYDKGFLCLTNYNDVETLCNLDSPMLAYFGPDFYNKCGFPFWRNIILQPLWLSKLLFGFIVFRL